MNPFPKDDQPLTDFLKQHRPVTPPASPELEENIMATIAARVAPEKVGLSDRPLSGGTSQRRPVWMIPSAIAAGLIVTLVGYKTLAPAPQPSPAEVAELEAFIESSWSNTVNPDLTVDHADDPLLLVEDYSSVN